MVLWPIDPLTDPEVNSRIEQKKEAEPPVPIAIEDVTSSQKKDVLSP